ncbi:hypothetical protein D9O50_11265 [Oxalobacteraceae bacterium CAVE-383]|nr:hypothetical protein D9O50_11265 [Oxalobacteraceae bacterium CAVE-383]
MTLQGPDVKLTEYYYVDRYSVYRNAAKTAQEQKRMHGICKNNAPVQLNEAFGRQELQPGITPGSAPKPGRIRFVPDKDTP